jgi:uncharacterized protein with HEPN domain
MRRDALIIAEMIEACDRATSLTDELKRVTATDVEPWALVAALSWQFTVIGEAARQVSEELKAAHPDIPWARAIGLRNVITHTYWRIDESVLTDTAVYHLPKLSDQLREVLADLTSVD